MSTVPTTYTELLSAVDAGARAPRAVPVHDPATEELIGYAPQLDEDDLDRVVATARQAQREWSARSEADRCELLVAAAEAIERATEPLAELLSREQGKPLNGPNARFEVGGCSAWTRATAGFELGEEVVVDDGQTRATLTYCPIGVVGAISPWNWPMMISIWQIAPSLQMGNTVVIKPSEHTPLSVLALVYVLNTVLPEGVLQIVPGGPQLGAAIARHEGIDKIMFTGSTATGRKIVEDSAPTLKRLTMELGGNDAGIVLEDTDPEAIAEGLFWGAFINTGQTCAALKRLYVPDALYEPVCRALTEFARAQPMGIGLEEQNVLGPLQNSAQYDVVDRLVRAAVEDGARVLLGGNPDAERPGFFYPTTLVADIDPEDPLVVQEQFGPALPIIRYSDLEWAIEQANALDVGLGASVWSSDPARAREVAARIEAGTVWINGHGGIDPRIPFGGIKSSGFGVEFGVEGLKHVAVPQVING